MSSASRAWFALAKRRTAAIAAANWATRCFEISSPASLDSCGVEKTMEAFLRPRNKGPLFPRVCTKCGEQEEMGFLYLLLGILLFSHRRRGGCKARITIRVLLDKSNRHAVF